jgi:hypothetical protein
MQNTEQTLFERLCNFDVSHENHIALCREYIEKYTKNGLEIEVKLKNSEEVDILKCKPLTINQCRKFADVVVKHCNNNASNLNELLQGNAKFHFINALEEFLIQNRCEGFENNLCSNLVEYNGEQMKIRQIKQNIFTDESEYENVNTVFNLMVDFYSWSYCFFLHSHDTALILYHELYLTMQQQNMMMSVISDRKTLLKAQEIINMSKEDIRNILNTSNNSKKNSKKQRTSKDV